jgi:hypothetical protein
VIKTAGYPFCASLAPRSGSAPAGIYTGA